LGSRALCAERSSVPVPMGSLASVCCTECHMQGHENIPLLQTVPVAVDNPLRKDSVAMVFEDAGGDLHVVHCRERPLGMKFTAHAPLIVTDVIPYSHASELNVQREWRLIKIGNERVDDLDVDGARSVLRDATLKLPLV